MATYVYTMARDHFYLKDKPVLSNGYKRELYLARNLHKKQL